MESSSAPAAAASGPIVGYPRPGGAQYAAAAAAAAPSAYPSPGPIAGHPTQYAVSACPSPGPNPRTIPSPVLPGPGWPTPTTSIVLSPVLPGPDWPTPNSPRFPPASQSQYLSPRSPNLWRSDGPPARTTTSPTNPFNFQTQIILPSQAKPTVGQRRGHRYKHSSISTQHQIFQPPPPRPPPVLPASLPIPTIREAWKSMHNDQRLRLYWCLCHLAVAVFVFFRSEGSLAMTALSHLAFFDAGSAAVCVAVDVLGNFEVWRRSSIRHPFGLERAEVLSGFAMSIFLLFGGFDLVSHSLKHVLAAMDGGDHASGQHHNHHSHHHAAGTAGCMTPGALNWPALSAILATVLSAYGLRNHTRISRVMRVSYLSSLPSILSNPIHFLTLSFSSILLLLPLLFITHHLWLDRLICGVIALAMFSLGFRLAYAQALMLLMSYGDGRGADAVARVIREIESEPMITSLEDAKLWRVHYSLGMANFRVSVSRHSDDSSLSKLRGRIAGLVQKRLGEGYGYGRGLRWEVTVETFIEPGPEITAYH